MSTALLGLSSIAACVGGVSEGGTRTAAAAQAEKPSRPDGAARTARDSSGGDASRKADSKPRPSARAERRAPEETRARAGSPRPIASEIHCPNGVLEDPHRGFVRCLGPDEKAPPWLPTSPQPEPRPGATAATSPPAAPAPAAPGAPAPAVGTPAAPVASAPPASAAPATVPPPVGPPPVVEVKAPAFENGEVPRAEKALKSIADDIGKCVAENGGLGRPTGTMKVQFLVRSRGRAEGVEILSSQGVSPEAASCVRLLLKNRSIGAPTADPVGVTVVLSLKPGPAR